jgi:hypothetical protein
MEGWEERASTKDYKEENELKGREDDFLHGWALEMSLARP